MGLVDYSDSDSEDERAHPVSTPPAKKRKIEKEKDALPPLPTSFLDQYSSTVRTSVHDDPSLHGGRTRVTPHIQGNWPTHIYLEWHPEVDEQKLLPKLIPSSGGATRSNPESTPASQTIHSLLQNDLGVPLPLHISLSRPLVLKTDQKDSFNAGLVKVINENSIKALSLHPRDVAWHPNESSTRWFLVVRLQTSPELSKLLDLCNSVAKEFGQPLLYATQPREEDKAGRNEFHISIAWSLQPPALAKPVTKASEMASDKEGTATLPYNLLEELCAVEITFPELKVRSGQDVHVVQLKPRRR